MQINKDYHIVSFAGKGSYLNICTDFDVTSGQNVNTYNYIENDLAQHWQLINTKKGYKIASGKNPAFVLDRWNGKQNPNNADIWLSRNWGEDMNDQLIDLLTLGENTFRIKLVKRDLYLTSNSPTTESNVYWAEFCDSPSQHWKISEVICPALLQLVCGKKPPCLNFDNPVFTAPFNPFVIGQCTWYVFGRTKQRCDVTIKFKAANGRNAGDWWQLVTNLTKSDFPALNRPGIAVWSGGANHLGHLAFVESFDGENVFLTESNWDNHGVINSADGIINSFTLYQLRVRSGLILQGFFVL